MSSLDDATVFDLLANARRRRMLRQLDAEGPATLRDLAKAVAANEEDRPAEDLTADEIRRVYISLYQTHLPRLKEAGVVAVDDQHQISLTDRADVPLAYLEFSPDQPDGLLSTARGFVGGEP